jgi:hypothetical protein
MSRDLQKVGQWAAQQIACGVTEPTQHGGVDLDDSASSIENEVAARRVLEKVLQEQQAGKVGIGRANQTNSLIAAITVSGALRFGQ